MGKKKKRNASPEEILTNETETTEVTEETEPEIIESPDAKYAELFDRYTRTLAEFDNFRKRTIKEKATRYDDGIHAAVEKLLPIIDNFERAMLSVESKEDTFYQGIALIARQFAQVVADLGIEEISAAAGTDFDPNLHHAVAVTQDEGFEANQITQELQKGYKHKEKVLRHSMVKVAE
jgi:molecular chaperone GrpE